MNKEDRIKALKDEQKELKDKNSEINVRLDGISAELRVLYEPDYQDFHAEVLEKFPNSFNALWTFNKNHAVYTATNVHEINVYMYGPGEYYIAYGHVSTQQTCSTLEDAIRLCADMIHYEVRKQEAAVKKAKKFRDNFVLLTSKDNKKNE
jgi:hypothetical protein